MTDRVSRAMFRQDSYKLTTALSILKKSKQNCDIETKIVKRAAVVERRKLIERRFLARIPALA